MLAIGIKEGAPYRNAQKADASEDAAKRKTRKNFSTDNSPPVSQRDLSKGKSANDQRCCLRTGVAAARDDQRNEQSQRDGLLDLTFKVSHRDSGQRLSEKQRGQPARTFADHARQSYLHVGFVESFRTSDPLNLFRCRCFRNIENIVDRDDSDQGARGVRHRQGRSVILAEDCYGSLLIVGRFQGYEPAIHKVAYPLFQRGEKELTTPNVIDQHALFIDDINDVQGLAVLTVSADVIEHLANGPMFTNAHIVRRHQAPDGAFGIAEK